ncbi:ATP-dependent DNA helicase sgs1 [Puccinia graminis f. sp. tritici]|uniref:DNA 3'-5' helicase n=1 Tax=Puccinia graminis f. sp. tritici TaxID=56615 RepID=A0A5B0RWK3_PUCGR|nr:ATP-dependent DNA helicase sgs1 [Puccinia graminis f. sp. tritici]
MNRSETERSTPIANDSSHEEDSDSGQKTAASNPIEDDSSNEEDSNSGQRITESEVIDEIAALNRGESLPDELASLKLQATSKKRVTLRQDILELNHQELKEHIRVESRNLYGDEAKDEQLEAVAALVHDRHTFVLAGTGFGKTRIAEMYHNLFQPYQKSIVLVLNPLDSLGDNQVEEKKKVGVNNRHIKAVNLTSNVLDAKMARKIISGEFEFVYLSPEALLNNEIFRDVYFHPKFQSRLSLIVVDEAHMVYVWGLVANGQSKGLTSHLKHGERGVFRPGYGELAARLMATNGTPLLMMSATCRPIAINSILESFKLTRQMVTFVEAELTRPEIRMLRIDMQKSLASSEDLADLYSTQEQTPDNEIIPTLIYSTTRNLTGQVLDVVNDAREANQEDDPFSTFARRYHSITGDMDKSDVTGDFTKGIFPVVSSTMALGLGQNWKRVRCVIHMGRGDPASICQMLGRCGRDGKKGLAIMFVEPHRKNGKNSVSDFTNVELQNDDDRMDALGYIPLSFDDPNYKREAKREVDAGFSECSCSNCKPESSKWVINNFKQANINNFDSFISNSPQDIAELFPIRQEKQVADNQINWVEESGKKPLHEILEAFAQALVRYFCDFFDSEMKGAAAYPPDAYFSIIHARKISRNIKHLTLDNIEQLIGNEMLTGQFKMLFDHITLFQSTDSYQYISHRQEELDAELDSKAARLRKEKEDEDNQRAEATRAIQEAAAQKKIDTAARVKANAEKKRTAKEAKFIESEKKKAKRESDMAFLHQLQAQAEIDRQNTRPDASDPETSKSVLVDESMDPALL